jgi:hypothetical protein
MFVVPEAVSRRGTSGPQKRHFGPDQVASYDRTAGNEIASQTPEWPESGRAMPAVNFAAVC